MAILVHDEAGVRRLTLHRPQKRNALTQAMYAALAEGLREAAATPAIRTVVITGGPDCFTAGNDIADFRGPFDAATSPVVDFLHTLASFPKPVVAAVAGHAVGIGTTMLLHCDLVYAQESARFALPFVNLGLCPEGASSLLLPQRAGALLANELLLLGEAFDAATAQRAGLVNAVVEDALAVAVQKAAALAAKPPAALAATKALLRGPQSASVTAQLDAEFARFAKLLTGPEAAEATAAFLERRPPDFSRFLA
jgi:enoyl-CoA hydratase/carnithine racemase